MVNISHINKKLYSENFKSEFNWLPYITYWAILVVLLCRFITNVCEIEWKTVKHSQIVLWILEYFINICSLLFFFLNYYNNLGLLCRLYKGMTKSSWTGMDSKINSDVCSDFGKWVKLRTFQKSIILEYFIKFMNIWYLKENVFYY